MNYVKCQKKISITPQIFLMTYNNLKSFVSSNTLFNIAIDNVKMITLFHKRNL